MRTRDERHDYEAALRRLPEAHSLALRLRDSGAPDDVICEYFREIQPRNETQQKFLVVSLNNLDKMSAERTERVTVARTDTGPPWSLWVVQFITSAMVLGYAIVFGGKVIDRALRDGRGTRCARRDHLVPDGGTLASVPRRNVDVA